MEEDRIREIIREEIDKLRIHQSQVIPSAIKDRHLDLGERAVGDIIYLDTEKRVKLLNAGTSGATLISGGSGAIPAWSTVSTGWTTANNTPDKTIDADGLVAEIGDGLTTLIDTLISIGILSA